MVMVQQPMTPVVGHEATTVPPLPVQLDCCDAASDAGTVAASHSKLLGWLQETLTVPPMTPVSPPPPPASTGDDAEHALAHGVAEHASPAETADEQAELMFEPHAARHVVLLQSHAATQERSVEQALSTALYCDAQWLCSHE